MILKCSFLPNRLQNFFTADYGRRLCLHLRFGLRTHLDTLFWLRRLHGRLRDSSGLLVLLMASSAVLITVLVRLSASLTYGQHLRSDCVALCWILGLHLRVPSR